MKAAAAAAEAAKRKQAEEAATAALAKKQKEQAMMVGSLESDLNMCKSQMANAVAKANGLAECKHSLAEFQLHSVAIDRRLQQQELVVHTRVQDHLPVSCHRRWHPNGEP